MGVLIVEHKLLDLMKIVDGVVFPLEIKIS